MRKNLFPYRFREGQRELIRFVRDEVRKGNVCVSAATGFGKTPAILAALLPYAGDHGIIWAVRTGNETDRPIEELKEINRATGSNFFGLSYRGKRDMCLLARDIKMEMGHDDVSFLCKTKGEECKYRKNLEGFDPTELAKKPMLYSEILNLCRDLEICPYLAQRELLPFADVVSLSYNYVVNEKMGWSIKRAVPFKNSILVVDEAHNLQQACSNLNSDRVTLRTVDRAMKELGELKTERAKEIEKLGFAANAESNRVFKRMKSGEAEFDAEDFLCSLLKRLRIDSDELNEEFRMMRDLGVRVRRKLLGQGKRPRSSLFHLANFWLTSIENLGTRGVAFLAKKERENLIFERWDMRAAEVLRGRWKEFSGCVFCSGTLSPMKAFAETAGLDKYSGKYIPSHYDPNRIVSLITKGLSTKGKELSEEMAGKYVKSIGDFVRNLKVNLAVFSASYRIQNGLLRVGLKDAVEEEGRIFFQEFQGMSGDRAREILDGFKACTRAKEPGVLCATATGRFAEGADFPGRELEGIFLVGIPFERMSIRTKLYLDYYRELYGMEKGSYYAYVVPALRRASQSLGRALRSGEDRVAFVLGDERYAQRRFLRLLPDFVRVGAEVTESGLLLKRLKTWDRRSRAKR